jgi:hypothetical protein
MAAARSLFARWLSKQRFFDVSECIDQLAVY